MSIGQNIAPFASGDMAGGDRANKLFAIGFGSDIVALSGSDIAAGKGNDIRTVGFLAMDIHAGDGDDTIHGASATMSRYDAEGDLKINAFVTAAEDPTRGRAADGRRFKGGNG